jgi:hypothetical protein
MVPDVLHTRIGENITIGIVSVKDYFILEKEQ